MSSQHRKLQDLVYTAINDKTKVVLCTSDNKVICSGNWFNDNILDYMHERVNNFMRVSTNEIVVWLDK